MIIVFLIIIINISMEIFSFISFFDYISEVVLVLADFWVEWVRFSDWSQADVESFLVAHEAIYDEFRVEIKSDLKRCFLITIEVFDDIIKNFRSILVYTGAIDESFVLIKEVWGIFWVLRAMNGVIDDPSVEKLC